MALFHRRKFLFGLAGAAGASLAGMLGAWRANPPRGESAPAETALGPQIALPPGLTPPSVPITPAPGYASYIGIRAS